MLKKEKAHAFGKDIYLLGKDKNGVKYWLEQSKFDCNWYWGIGYVETYTNNNNPKIAKDVASHGHFNYMFLKNKDKNCMDSMNNFFEEMTLDKNELYTLWEIMKSLYTLKEYSDMLHAKGSHITTNPCFSILENEQEYERINKIVIPKLLEKLYELLTENE